MLPRLTAVHHTMEVASRCEVLPLNSNRDAVVVCTLYPWHTMTENVFNVCIYGLDTIGYCLSNYN